uniref:Uncharacterized protein n=1 Tax=Anguilla anguilla TaxID=7936 RepID=A0A0E9TNF1_ANGAN
MRQTHTHTHTTVNIKECILQSYRALLLLGELRICSIISARGETQPGHI